MVGDLRSARRADRGLIPQPRVPARPRLWLLSTLLAIAVTTLEPVRSTIWFGQINVFLVLLVVWDLTRPAGSRLRGTCTGIAAASSSPRCSCSPTSR
ncbi:DUF2029 domain-containing protein [Rhodococcus hoagii]|nr:DUF2029 domain-containing protein [Prescottella equi]